MVTSDMPSANKVVLALGILVLLACGEIGGCLFQNEARYQQEREALLSAAEKTRGMKAADAERALRSMRVMTECNVIRSDESIFVISKHKYNFVGNFAIPAVELTIDASGSVSDVQLIERGGAL